MKSFVGDNQILISVVIAWAGAQIIKTLLTLWIDKKFVPERLIGSGGMPSSHSSTVCALAVSTAFIYTIHSFEFSISLVLAIIVMHDAMNVRLETGKQAQIINAMLKDNPFNWKGDVFEQHLKELVGHTPTQVVCGALFGIIVALIVNAVVTP
ncbi:MAG: divergent PAP2 family protein [Eubacteriales bacterium]|nr:divergent PAP2 family protein [Eubacteriales bacterium]